MNLFWKSLSPKLIYNRAKSVNSYLKKDKNCGGYPIELIVEPTNICNMKCVMCPTGTGEVVRQKGYMEMSLFKKIIDQSKDYVETVCLFLAGEPLLHPELTDMIQYCRDQGVSTAVHTNGSYLDESLAEKFLISPPDILSISFDGFTKEIFEKIRVRGNFDEIQENVYNFIKLKCNQDSKLPYFIMQLIKMNQNETDINSFFSKWKIKGVDNIRIKPLFENPSYKTAKKSWLPGPEKKAIEPCPLLWRQFTVHWDGTVVLCCQDFLPEVEIGNTKDSSILELGNSEKMQEIRSLHIDGNSDEISLCKRCAIPQTNILFLAGSILTHNTVIKSRVFPFLENLWLIKKLKWLGYFVE